MEGGAVPSHGQRECMSGALAATHAATQDPPCEIGFATAWRELSVDAQNLCVYGQRNHLEPCQTFVLTRRLGTGEQGAQWADPKAHLADW